MPNALSPWDGVVERLQVLRKSAGSPSYEVIAHRISARREEAGISPHAARVAKSTVYDSMRTGRARLSVEFLYEIAEVIGGTQAQVDEWVREHHAPTVEEEASVVPPTLRQASVLMVVCLLLNLIGREFVDFFNLPVYLDMVGTGIAAIALGPWRGALVGGSTNLLGAIGSGAISIPFGLVNITGALLWGYGVRRWRMARSLHHFFALNILVGLGCSALAVPIIKASLHDDLRVGHDVITQLVGESVDNFMLALGLSNLMTSVGDKLISGFVALVVVSALPAAYRKGVEWIRIP